MFSPGAMKAEILRYPSLQDLSRAAAKFIIEMACACVHERGIFTLVLSGGETPRVLYEQLAQGSFDAVVPWTRTHLFWGDERCVAPEHPHSNFGMAFKALLSKVPAPWKNIHRIPAELDPPEAGAIAYETVLRDFFYSTADRTTPSPFFPSFDLILLGMGKDGHTASLFPNDNVLEERERLVAAVLAPAASPFVPRITLTLPVINSAKCVIFLVSGPGKEDALRMILADPKSAAQSYPAARVQPQGSLIWFLDEGAVWSGQYCAGDRFYSTAITLAQNQSSFRCSSGKGKGEGHRSDLSDLFHAFDLNCRLSGNVPGMIPYPPYPPPVIYQSSLKGTELCPVEFSLIFILFS
jgi:6-phosphogluconolactonase